MQEKKHIDSQSGDTDRSPKSVSLPRAISIIENEAPGYRELMKGLRPLPIPVIGITGPPGAGKSTLTDSLIRYWTEQGKKIGVLCVDPSSPFHRGALLGDRIRMSRWYADPKVFIRSLASRGSLGGLHPKIIEITELMKSSGFDIIITETVGVGQSEVEISALADVTVLVLVPEGGDDVQAIKSGIMEIASVFAVNKSDRPEADVFVRHLRNAVSAENIPIIKTVATQQLGITELVEAIESQLTVNRHSSFRNRQLAEKAFQLIQQEKMRSIHRQQLIQLFEEGKSLLEVVAMFV